MFVFLDKILFKISVVYVCSVWQWIWHKIDFWAKTFFVKGRVILKTDVKAHLRDATSRMRLSFWRMKTTADGTISVDQLTAKFKTWQLYTQLLEYIRQSKNRIRLVASCRWALSLLFLLYSGPDVPILVQHFFRLRSNSSAQRGGGNDGYKSFRRKRRKWWCRSDILVWITQRRLG